MILFSRNAILSTASMTGKQSRDAFANDDEQVKEVFAHFGLAFYLSGVFETALAHAILTLDFLTAKKGETDRLGTENVNRAKFEADFDAFLQSQHDKTLGNLLRRFYELIDINESFKSSVKKAKERRDFLAHNFFRENAENFNKRIGREKMLAELEADQQLFEAADKELTAHMLPIMRAMGVPVEAIEARVKTYIAVNKDQD